MQAVITEMQAAGIIICSLSLRGLMKYKIRTDTAPISRKGSAPIPARTRIAQLNPTAIPETSIGLFIMYLINDSKELYFFTIHYYLLTILACRPSEFSACHKVEMDVLNCLAAIIAAIVNNAEATIHFKLLRKLSNNLENMCNYCAVFFVKLSRGGNV